MARIVKEEEHAIKRKEILDVAQRLIYTKGYEQMTIQDILAEAQISKGAFYHYFDSKQALLEGLIERIRQEAEAVMEPVLKDENLPALEKLHRYFDMAARWKSARKELMLALLRTWYDERNALLRQKVQAATIQWLAPNLAEIIRQGIGEGSLSTPYPEQAGGVATALLVGMSDTAAGLLLAGELKAETFRQFAEMVAAYNNAMERVLGAAPGSIRLMDPEILKEWVEVEEE